MRHSSLIINADDFGWTDGHNWAVERAYSQGALNRASLMCTGNAFNSAIDFLHQHPDFSVGIHLTLNEGKPLLLPKFVPNLVDNDGQFYDSYFDLFSLWLHGKLQPSEVFPEWQAQIERALLSGIRITHLDSHKHVHMLPPLLDVIIKLSQIYDISYVRLPLEKDFTYTIKRFPASLGLWILALRAKKYFNDAGIHFAENFYGIGLSGSMTYEYLKKIIQSPHNGLTEIMVHPAKITSDVSCLQHRYAWAAKYKFEEELTALIKIKSNGDEYDK